MAKNFNLEYGYKRGGIATILNLEVEDYWVNGFNNFKMHHYTDVTIQFPNGDTQKTTLDKLYKPNQRTIDIYGKYKWDFPTLPRNNGYYGQYSVLEYEGKKAIVFIDDRDALVKVVTDWYDEIYYGDEYHTYWSGDYRWNSDKPIVVQDKEKGYNINKVHQYDLMCDEWLWYIDPKMKNGRYMGDYFEGRRKNVNWVNIHSSGTFVEPDETADWWFERELEKVKKYSSDDCINLWIKENKQCAFIRGLEYKGAKPRIVTREEAEELIKTHNQFVGSFNSAEWDVINGKITLLFREYADSDYD